MIEKIAIKKCVWVGEKMILILRCLIRRKMVVGSK